MFPKGAFTLKFAILVLLWGSPHLLARNPENPGVPQTGSPKRSVYSEIDDFGAFVGSPHLVTRTPENPGVPKTGSPKRSVYSGIDDFEAFVGFPPHLVARNPQNPGVPKTGSPKRSVYSEIDDFVAFVGFPPFGDQGFPKQALPKGVFTLKLKSGGSRSPP